MRKTCENLEIFLDEKKKETKEKRGKFCEYKDTTKDGKLISASSKAFFRWAWTVASKMLF